MARPFLEFEEKIFTLLSTDQQSVAAGSLGDLGIQGVYNLVGPDGEDDSALPYIIIGESEWRETDSKTGTNFGYLGTTRIRVWDRDHSGKTLYTVLDRIHELLHDTDLALTNFNTVNMRATLTEVFPEPDNRTLQALQEYSVHLGG